MEIQFIIKKDVGTTALEKPKHTLSARTWQTTQCSPTQTVIAENMIVLQGGTAESWEATQHLAKRLNRLDSALFSHISQQTLNCSTFAHAEKPLLPLVKSNINNTWCWLHLKRSTGIPDMALIVIQTAWEESLGFSQAKVGSKTYIVWYPDSLASRKTRLHWAYFETEHDIWHSLTYSTYTFVWFKPTMVQTYQFMPLRPDYHNKYYIDWCTMTITSFSIL